MDAVMPKRVQLSRQKGWRMPPNTVKVDRTTRWGNPFLVLDKDDWHSRRAAVGEFARAIRRQGGYLSVRGAHLVTVEDIRRGLAGKSLACWCPLDQPCHADVLLKIANEVR